MKPPYRTLVLIATAATAAAAVFASLWLTSEATKEPAVGEPSPFLPSPPAPPRETVLFGHIGSLTRAEDDFELRVDPADFLGGTTANRAAIDDGVIRPGEVMPNDHYTRDEGHLLLSFFMPSTARVTVLAGGARSTRVTVPELLRMVERRSPGTAGPGLGGFWIHLVDVTNTGCCADTVVSLDEQYTP